MPFLKNCLCCLPLRQGCMWMAKICIFVLMVLMINDQWDSAEIKTGFINKEKTRDLDKKLFVLEISAILVLILMYFGAKYKSRTLLLPCFVDCIVAESFLGYNLHKTLTKGNNQNASYLKKAFKNSLKNQNGKLEPMVLILLYYIIAYVIILYIWIMVFSYLLHLHRAAKLENCKPNENVNVKDMAMVQPLGKSESGRDLFVMAMKE